MNKLDTLVLTGLIALGLVGVIALALAGVVVPDQLWVTITTLIGGLVGRMLPSSTPTTGRKAIQ